MDVLALVDVAFRTGVSAPGDFALKHLNSCFQQLEPQAVRAFMISRRFKWDKTGSGRRPSLSIQ